MPELDEFEGITIKMQCERNAKHKAPHFHAHYSGSTASYGLDGTLLASKMPSKQSKRIEEWARSNAALLQEYWSALQKGHLPAKMDFKH